MNLKLSWLNHSRALTRHLNRQRLTQAEQIIKYLDENNYQTTAELIDYLKQQVGQALSQNAKPHGSFILRLAFLIQQLQVAPGLGLKPGGGESL